MKKNYLIACLYLIATACVDDDASNGPGIADVRVKEVIENFDANETLTLKGTVNTSKPDTIAEYGFVYTDGKQTFPAGFTLSPATDRKIVSTNIGKSTGAGSVQNEYEFSAVVNPTRSIAPGGTPPTCCVAVPVMAYAKSTSGFIATSDIEFNGNPKAKIVSLSPSLAVPGTSIVATLNRYVDPDHLIIINSVLNTRGTYKADLMVNGNIVPYTLQKSSGTDYVVTFQMPSGVTSETSLVLRINALEATSATLLKNSTLKFTQVNQYDRTYDGEPLLFAISNFIYYGGGKTGGVNGTTLRDFKRFDITSSTWTPVADYPGEFATGMAFTINDKAYVGSPQQSFTAYTSTTNTWQQLTTPTLASLSTDHTFRPSATGVVNGKAYFTYFRNELFGGAVRPNFFSYDPSSHTFQTLKAFPGSATPASDYMDRAVLYGSKLHFFPPNQHWSYDITSNTWTRHADFMTNASLLNDVISLRPFVVNNTLYVIRNYRFMIGTSWVAFDIYKYDSAADKWNKDSELLQPSVIGEIYPLDVNGTVYLCTIQQGNDRLTIYKVQ